jgi:lipopolysaccharide biosynthesis glycosyltransferase
MKRALVTGCNTKFLNGAKGLLRSVRMFHPEVSRYCLAPDAELDEVRAQLGELATVVVAPRKVSGVPDQWLMQLLAARIFIPTFPEDVVAWVDSDAIFCASAPELWEVPVGKVNVVRDAVYDIIHMVPMDTWDVFERQFGYARNHPGFNAGIYALRSADWRDLPERYEKA